MRRNSMTRREEIEIKALSEYRIKEKENKKATGTYDANLPRRKAFIEGAEWMQKKMIEKACEILENVTVTYNKRFFGKCEENAFDADFIKEFRQAMEE